jgi:GntR family transcriptional regulator, transcriptional repressor for pyruvate dehydrogenase complex
MRERIGAVKDSRQLLDDLKKLLIEEGLRPGDRVYTETALARRFNVSRARIREATTTLCQLGVLESRPRRGTVVKSFDALATGEHLGFHFAVGGLPLADSREARLVIERSVLPLVIRRITPSQIEELRQTIRRMETAKSARDVFEADRDFHVCLLGACGNRTLQAFAQVIMGIFDQHAECSSLEPHTRERSITEHRELVERIEAEDLEGALETLTRHLKEPPA